jgi:hypothetical protein
MASSRAADILGESFRNRGEKARHHVAGNLIVLYLFLIVGGVKAPCGQESVPTD